MRKRITLAATLAVAAIGIGASSASAATLYTTSAHTTAVAVGTTFTASTPTTAGYNYTWNSPSLGLVARCNSAKYTFKVTKNSLGVFKAETTTGSFSSCEPELSGSNFGVILEITGSSITVGTGKAWLGSTLKEINIFWGGANTFGSLTSATGNPPANGVSAQQPAAAVPVSVVLSNAGTLNSPVGPATVTGSYTLTGTAANYSLG